MTSIQDLPASLRRAAAICPTTDRAAVFTAAADEIERLGKDRDRLDWVVRMRTGVTTAGVYPGVWFCETSQGGTIREAIDNAMAKGKGERR